MRYREFDVGFCFYLVSPCAGQRLLVCSRFGIPSAFATAGLMLALLFIFIDPCAGRRFLVCLRLGVPSACATAGLMLALLFYFH
jgi:hypothetical protein